MKKLTLILFLSLVGVGLKAQTYSKLYATSVVLQNESNGNTITLSMPMITGDVILLLPDNTGANGQILTGGTGGFLSWTTPIVSGIPGNDGEVFYKDDSDLGADNGLYFHDTTKHLGINVSNPLAGIHTSGAIKAGDGTNAAGLKIYSEQGATDYIFTLNAPTNTTSSKTFVWPNNYGLANQLLTTNGSGQFGWSSTAVSSGADCIGIGVDDDDVGNNSVSGSLGFIGGGTENEITSGGANSFIGAGKNNTISGSGSAIGAGEDNTVQSDFSFIAGGRYNIIKDEYSVILGGFGNTIETGASYTFIGAGDTNTIKSQYSTIGAGRRNIIDTASNRSFIGSGGENYIRSAPYAAIMAGRRDTILNGSYNHIGAGEDNKISNASYSSIFAGKNNEIRSGTYNTIGSGENNVINSGNYSTIVAGESNTLSGDYSMVLGNNSRVNANYAIAMGRNATAKHEGSFVMKDGRTDTVSSSATNQFTALFYEAGELYTNTGLNAGVRLGRGNTSWSSISDINRKENIVELDYQEIYSKFSLLDISSWSYKDVDNIYQRFYGPMAQEFCSIFGTDDYGKIGTETTIVPIHLTSISVSVLKHAETIIGSKQEKLESLKKDNTLLESEIEILEAQIRELEANND